MYYPPLKSFYQVLAFTVLCLGVATRCTAIVGTRNSSSQAKMATRFYEEKGSPSFWYNRQDALISNLRISLLQFVDSAGYWGIDNKKYNFPRQDYSLLPEAQLFEKDLLFTTALIAFARDVYCGANISAHLKNDEISKKYTAATDSTIYSWLCGITNHTDMAMHFSQLLPRDSAYIILQEELRAQINKRNFAKVKSVAQCLNFYRWINHFHFSKYILVNIPSATLTAFDDGKPFLEMKVVAGKASTRTPRMATWCNKVILYPYWNVPGSIARKELLPKFKKSPGKVAEMNMQILDSKGRQVDPYGLNWKSFNSSYFPYLIRQCTGCDNALGVIKFNLTNPFDVYMHDTNYKLAFGAAARHLSHGCIRVERPIELGNYLLDNTIDSNFLKACFKNQKPVTVEVAKPVPVFVLYMTAKANNDTVVYLRDIYKLN